MQAPKLDDILKPGHPLPPDEVMVAKALEILNHCPHGQKLADFAADAGIAIKIIATPQPTTYQPEPRVIYVGFNRNNPVSPAAFVLMVAGALREAQQDMGGVKHPPLHAPRQEHLKVSMAKHEDRVWYMCTVAFELNDQSTFTEYKFLDELRKMGHDEAIALYVRQERQN